MRLASEVVLVVGVVCLGSNVASAQTRTPWEMHQGLGVDPDNPRNPKAQLVKISCNPGNLHGAVCEYDDAVIPGDSDPSWRSAPDTEIIGMDFACTLANGEKGSLVCYPPTATDTHGAWQSSCFVYADFTYFQTFIDVPLDVIVNRFTITFSGMDDGSRVTIFNSGFPDGHVIPGSYVYLNGTGTANLADYVVSGEVNRVVVTQVDDCCCENRLRSAQVVLNGKVVPTGCQITGCEDGNACTIDLCQPDFTCGHEARSCDDGNACTADGCDAALGCVHTPVSCDDGNACTADSCDAALGCVHTPVSCDDASVCTTDTCDPAAGCVHTPVSCDDGNACTADSCDAALGCLHVDRCPDCSAASPTRAIVWPPNHRWVQVGVHGVTDPQGQPVSIAVTGISQDEPTWTRGDCGGCRDGAGVGTSVAVVRAERDERGDRRRRGGHDGDGEHDGWRGTGDGRVYHVYFTATDPDGYSCSGEVTTCVPHDLRGGGTCVDEGPLYDSLTCHR